MEKKNPQQSGNASTFVKCLGCTKLVRLPADPDPNAMARCPRCGETYQIGALLDSEIPELEVLGGQSSPTGPAIVAFESDGGEKDSGETVAKDEFNRFIVAPALAKGAKRKRRRRSSSSESSDSKSSDRSASASSVSVDVDERDSESGSRRSSSSSSSSSSRGSSSRSSESSRRRRRQPKKNDSPALEGVKVMFGALLAPPVAQLVIWWVLGLDPLGLGPTVSKYFPPLVPAQFSAEKETDEPRAGDGFESSRDRDGLIAE